MLDRLLIAPVGVALLGRLEARHLSVSYEVPDGTSPRSVAAAAEEVAAMTVGELLAIAFEAGYRSAGPWSGSANLELMRAYRDSGERTPIAEAVVAQLAPFDDTVRLDSQEWWHTNHRAEGWFAQPRLVALDSRVYENGEFTHQGVWTVTAPPPEAHQGLASAWELDEGPISRWRLPVRAGARVFEVNEPADWVRLVNDYGRIAARPNCAWELPGMNDHLRDRALAPLSHGRAARNEMDRLVVPEWSRVAQDYDGVRLSWRGWLTTEGFISDTPDGGVTWLRYWFSERTLWLNDVFGDPEPLPRPFVDEGQGVDVTADEVRRERDREVLHAMLRR